MEFQFDYHPLTKKMTIELQLKEDEWNGNDFHMGKVQKTRKFYNFRSCTLGGEWLVLFRELHVQIGTCVHIDKFRFQQMNDTIQFCINSALPSHLQGVFLPLLQPWSFWWFFWKEWYQLFSVSRFEWLFFLFLVLVTKTLKTLRFFWFSIFFGRYRRRPRSTPFVSPQTSTRMSNSWPSSSVRYC